MPIQGRLPKLCSYLCWPLTTLPVVRGHPYAVRGAGVLVEEFLTAEDNLHLQRGQNLLQGINRLLQCNFCCCTPITSLSLQVEQPLPDNRQGLHKMFLLCKPGFMQHCAVTHFLSYSSLGYAYFQNSPEAKSGYNTFFPYIGAFIFVSFISKKYHLFPKLTARLWIISCRCANTFL